MRTLATSLGTPMCQGAGAPGRALRLARAPRRIARHACRAQIGQGGADMQADSSSSSSVPAAPSVGVLSGAAAQSLAFKSLSATSAVLAAAAAVAPEALLAAGGAPPGASGTIDALFLRIAACTLLLSSAVEYCLADAAANGRLGSATYQSLLLGVVCKSSGYLVVFGLLQAAWSPLVSSLYPLAAGASVAVAGATLMAATAGQPGALAAAVGRLLTPARPQTAVGWTYSVFAALYLFTVAGVFLPDPLFGGAPSALGLLVKWSWAPGFLLAAVACNVLRDAADRGRLAASTFKRLNLGLALLEAGYTAVLAGAVAGGLVGAGATSDAWPNLAGSCIIAAFCLTQRLTAKKKPA